MYYRIAKVQIIFYTSKRFWFFNPFLFVVFKKKQ